MTKRHFFSVIVFCISLAGTTLAVTPDEMLADPALEARAREVSKELRCVVCQNQSIDDSNAPLAHDMRVLVRERILAGDSGAEVKAFLVSRYGDFVLLKPRVKGDTLFLWFGPFLMLGLAASGFALYLRRPKTELNSAPNDRLSDDEARRIAEIREKLAS